MKGFSGTVSRAGEGGGEASFVFLVKCCDTWVRKSAGSLDGGIKAGACRS